MRKKKFKIGGGKMNSDTRRRIGTYANARGFNVCFDRNGEHFVFSNKGKHIRAKVETAGYSAEDGDGNEYIFPKLGELVENPHVWRSE
jgi:hypothetical protein